MTLNVYLSRFAVLFCITFLTAGAAATTIATFQSFVIGQGTNGELDPADIGVSPLFAVTRPSELTLFSEAAFFGSDVGATLSWTADATNETDFAAIAAILTNGIDNDIGLWSSIVGNGGNVGNIYLESEWLADFLAPGEVDLSNYTVTSMVMTVTNISFIPFDGEFTRLRWDSITYDVIGHPVPVPAPLLLLVSALGVFVRWRPGSLQSQ